MKSLKRLRLIIASRFQRQPLITPDVVVIFKMGNPPPVMTSTSLSDNSTHTSHRRLAVHQARKCVTGWNVAALLPMVVTTTLSEFDMPHLAAIVDVADVGIHNNNIHDNSKGCDWEKSLFWLSPMARLVYANLLVAILVRKPKVLFGTLILVVYQISKTSLHWLQYYFVDDPEFQRSLLWIGTMLQTIVQESEKAVEGDYSRLVMAGYIMYNCTAPGESYLSYVIRYKMSMLNNQVIDEMEDWRLRRLGYKRSETKRNLMS